ncbi:hypothetical protein [Spirosoma luteum]|uniref:hypothetical protein n=1 Tax=Spirosoma luteum TaxID=431553 RepID=UPI000365479C|nr:hypothetical protein [Spirosoma luteum]
MHYTRLLVTFLLLPALASGQVVPYNLDINGYRGNAVESAPIGVSITDTLQAITVTGTATASESSQLVTPQPTVVRSGTLVTVRYATSATLPTVSYYRLKIGGVIRYAGRVNVGLNAVVLPPITASIYSQISSQLSTLQTLYQNLSADVAGAGYLTTTTGLTSTSFTAYKASTAGLIQTQTGRIDQNVIDINNRVTTATYNTFLTNNALTIADINTRVSSNSAAIGTNATSLSSLSLAVGNNTTSITNNTTSIASVSATGTTNSAAIASLSSATATLTSRVNSNSTAIGINTAGIVSVSATANTALTTANSATATGATNASAIAALSVTVGNNATAITAKTFPTVLSNLTTTPRLMAGLIDSHTDGAGGLSYVDYIRPKLRGAYGDGGLGFMPIENGPAGSEDVSFGKSSNMQYLSSYAFNTVPTTYALTGQGLSCSACSGTDSWSWGPRGSRTSQKIRLYYLKQPGGGSFKFGFGATSSSTYPTYQTDSTSAGIAWIELTPTVDWSVAAASITGKVTFFALHYYNSTGVSFGRWATGGRKMQDINKLSSTFRQAWYNFLKPDALLIDALTNDRMTVTADTAKTWLTTYTNDVKAGSPNTKVVMVHGVEPSDHATTYFDSYAAMKQTIPKTEYLNLVDRMGGYTALTAGGYMLDGVHLSATAVSGVSQSGDELRAQATLRYLGVSTATPSLAASIAGGGAATTLRTGTLTDVASTTTASSGVGIPVLELGILNGSHSPIFDLNVYLKTQSSSNSTRYRVQFVVNAQSSPAGTAGSVNSITVTPAYSTTGGAAPTATFSLSINGSAHAVLTMTPGATLSNWYLSGSYVDPVGWLSTQTEVYQYSFSEWLMLVLLNLMAGGIATRNRRLLRYFL